MKNKLKYFVFVYSVILLSIVIFAGCDNKLKIEAGFISKVGSTAKTEKVVKFDFLSDKRINNKIVDIQLKADKIASVIAWKENGKKEKLVFDDYDTWYSLTEMFSNEINKDTHFVLYKDAVSKLLTFSYPDKLEITFRIVVGNKYITDENKELILESFPISNQFTIRFD